MELPFGNDLDVVPARLLPQAGDVAWRPEAVGGADLRALADLEARELRRARLHLAQKLDGGVADVVEASRDEDPDVVPARTLPRASNVAWRPDAAIGGADLRVLTDLETHVLLQGHLQTRGHQASRLPELLPRDARYPDASVHQMDGVHLGDGAPAHHVGRDPRAPARARVRQDLNTTADLVLVRRGRQRRRLPRLRASRGRRLRDLRMLPAQAGGGRPCCRAGSLVYLQELPLRGRNVCL
mmetsp:Transcript_62954/g.198833  ORF Transcript_62954/g.198833 Transcript_62954/m.198833 type:complete len:241 (-) Transcript_62954:991-1713(-)